MRSIVAVIPAYNEETAIGSVVLKTKIYVSTVIVIDDGSRDATSKIASLAGAKVITLPDNGGKARAVFRGIEEAKKEEPLVIVLIDADGQHDPDDIPSVISPILDNNADLVVGSRFITASSEVPRYRRLGQKSLDFITNTNSTLKCSDTQNGFRALGKAAYSQFTFRSEGFSLESDMLNHFASLGLRVTEVPVRVRYDLLNQHKVHPIHHGFDVFSTIFLSRIMGRPAFLLGIPGFIIGFFGMITGLMAFRIYDTTKVFPFSYALLSILLLIIGVLLCTSGLTLQSLAIILKKNRLM
ncbi:MAG: glycosyltransferase family 2 protein [Methanospirillaceae archaeon]|nr:glycosyltransferase family 2 protein [Methanospirillaceae archaeon]